MPVHNYTVAMTCGGCSGAVTRILTKQLDAANGEKFKVSSSFCVIRVSRSTFFYHMSFGEKFLV